MEFYKTNVNDVLSVLNSNKLKGLTKKEVQLRQKQYGINELKEKKRKSFLSMLLEQFDDFLVIILLVAADISIITSLLKGQGLTDGIIILVIVFVNALLGVTQEQKANNALAALKKLSSPHARVLRDGKIVEVLSNELTIGDIVYIETGDYVSADMRLIESNNLKIEEAALTGESVPVEKDAKITYQEDRILAERHNMVYMSTLVTYGKAIGVVVNVGMQTEIGKIAKMLDSVEDVKTPLQNKVDELALKLGIICISVSAFVFLLGVLESKDLFDIFLTAIALAVAAIPEGLTAVITVVLALGMQRMVKHNVIIKNLSTIETLGQATVICSDKTGTLTQNKMTVKRVYDFDNEYQVTGSGYSTSGSIVLDENRCPLSHNLDMILKICLLCNDAKLESANKIIGDPTEGALLVLGKKGGFDIDHTISKYPRVNEYQFDSTRKLMTTINKIDNKYFVLTKGACDRLVKICKYVSENGTIREITKNDINQILNKNEEYSKQAYRVLGFAYKETENYRSSDLERDLIFVGLVAMIDPPKEEVKDAIALCSKAGIRVMMITGDHLTTAKAIASELNILKPGHIALSGEKTSTMTEKEYEEAILKCDVFARSTPNDKLKIVDILQKHGEIVAMTGDGVNDAPALKQANIGVAMGIGGSEVSKEASSMILTDDNFASIVSAVKEGRIIYNNIKKFTVYLISCNIGEIFIILLSMIFAGLFKYYIPLLAIHLLWINLMTDSFPAFALGLEENEENIMDKHPISSKEKILSKQTLIKIVVQGLGLAIAALTGFYIGLNLDGSDIVQARTMIFITVVLGELLRTYSSRSDTTLLIKMNPFSNKYVNYSVLISLVLLGVIIYVPQLAILFSIKALTGFELIVSILLGFFPMLLSELFKMFAKQTT